MNKKWEDIKVVAFDADDTLWDCQSWFDEVERKCCERGYCNLHHNLNQSILLHNSFNLLSFCC